MHSDSENKHENSNPLLSKQKDYLWLEEKLKLMVSMNQQENNNNIFSYLQLHF